MISAVVLTHNDEQIIENTLKHLTWCDQILVIDDFSTDRTVEITKKHHVTVYQRHLGGDYAAQRNFALEKTKDGWILFIDSDEIVTKELREEVEKSVNNADVAGYFITRRDIMFGRELRHGEMGNIHLLRLAQKNAGSWVRPVHEVWDVQETVGNLVSPLYHYPHPNVAQFLDEINTYSSLNARYLFSQRVRASRFAIVAYPAAKFFVNYLWRLGFLDGTAGAIAAIMMSFHSFLTRAKLFQLWQTPQA